MFNTHPSTRLFRQSPNIHRSIPSIWMFHVNIVHPSSTHHFVHPSIHSSTHPFIHLYINACIHKYRHTYVRTYIHIYIHTHTHTHIHTYTHTYTHTPIHLCTLIWHPIADLFLCWGVVKQSFIMHPYTKIHLPIYPSIIDPSNVHPPINSSII